MSIKRSLLLGGIGVAALVGAVIVGRGCTRATPRSPAASPGVSAARRTLPGYTRTESPARQGEAGAILERRAAALTPAEKAAVTALVEVHLRARAEGDEEAVRAQLSVPDIFDDMSSEDPNYASRPEWYRPIEKTPENLAIYENTLVTDILRETPAEREDFAQKAKLTHIIPLSDGRFFVRIYGEDVLATRESHGRLVGDTMGPVYLPNERRMLVAPVDGGWKIVAFPRYDRYPPLEPS